MDLSSMPDNEVAEVITETVHRELKARIKRRIFVKCWPETGVLYVNIYNGKSQFTLKFNGVLQAYKLGAPIDQYINVTETKFRHFVFNGVFSNKEKQEDK